MNREVASIRRRVLVLTGLMLLLALVAGPRLLGRSVQPPRPTSPAPSPTPTGGDALAPIKGQPYIFERARRPVRIQPSSVSLAESVSAHPRLLVQPQPSTEGTAAIFLQEQVNQPVWGELFVPAERGIFQAFADDPAMGDWLIVMVDVSVVGERDPVTGSRDPVPLTAYRWPRASVEAYARCGIPKKDVEGCTRAFFADARTVFFAPHARLWRGI